MSGWHIAILAVLYVAGGVTLIWMFKTGRIESAPVWWRCEECRHHNPPEAQHCRRCMADE